MATFQIQKTQTAKTITKTAIDQEQSLEVVQTMLHGGLSSLSYLRQFFADKAFDQQLYDMSDRIHSYRDYAEGKLVKQADEANGPCTAMRILRRGRSKRVDIFLEWLERDAFTALKASQLQALQVKVHTDPANRKKVIETYTFSIHYNSDATRGSILAGLELDGPGSSLVSVQATNTALQIMLRQIMGICEVLPVLPEKRFISMELFYVPRISRNPSLKGWVNGTGDELLFAHARGWEKQTKTIRELSSSFHRSGLKISSLRRSSRRNSAGPPSALPKSLQYSVTSSAQAEIHISDTDPKVLRLSSVASGKDVTSTMAGPDPTTEEDDNPTVEVGRQTRRTTVGKPTVTPPLTSECVPTAAPERGLHINSPTQSLVEGSDFGAYTASQVDDTQSTHVLTMKQALRGMMQPECITQGDTQTQALFHAPPSLGKTTETASQYTETPTGPRTVAQNKPALSLAKASMLQRDKQRLHQRAFDLARRSGRKNMQGDVVLCQCGHQQEVDDMVECTYCGTWQHLACYGYTGADDPRLPDDHTCYQCLLGDDHLATLATLQDLALKRRGMDLALQHGIRSQRDFAADLELAVTVAGPVYQHLKNAGYVVPTSGSHKAGHKGSGKPLFVAVKEGPNHEKMLQNLFDPLMHIKRYYDLPPNLMPQQTTLAARLLASQAGNMPPPATPASALRKKDAITPASGLDIRASMTPFRTPSRLRSRQPQLQKRVRDEDATRLEPARKRSAAAPDTISGRLQSVTTQLLLNANGLPSSPSEASTFY